MDNQAFTVNGDGSVDLTIEGQKVRFIKESDLGAVKSALKDKEGEVSTLQANLATATTKFDTEHQNVLKERAAKELLEKSGKDGEALQVKVTGLETQVADLTKVSGETATKLTDRLRGYLETAYKVDKTKLEGKTLAEMESIESALQLTGIMPTPANYDGKGGVGDGGGGELVGKTPLALATLGYAQKK